MTESDFCQFCGKSCCNCSRCIEITTGHEHVCYDCAKANGWLKESPKGRA